jgi:hypothetical protein
MALIVVVYACTSNTIMKKPDDLISKDQMVDLLTDMYLAVSAEHIKNINDESKINYFQLIHDKYQIDSTQFQRSSFYYSSIIDEYDEILSRVQKNLKDLNSEYNRKIKVLDSISQVKKDSLREIRRDSIKKSGRIRVKNRTIPKPKTSSKVKS